MSITWAKIIGQSPEFNLEARIFNGVCFLTALGTLFGTIGNLLLEAQQVAVLFTIVFGCMAVCYYYARVKQRFLTGVLLYMISTNILNFANFWYNSGVNGPALLIYTLSNFLVVSIIPKKQYLFWISLNVLIVLSLLLVQYRYPHLIPTEAVTNRFIRMGFVYCVTLVFIFQITKYIRESYNSERALVEKHAAELQIANETKNKLFSILAHDLQSPLSSIQNYLEVLSELRLDQDERQSFEKNLLTSTRGTKQMVSNLLLWSKAQMDGVKVNLAGVDVKRTVHEIFKTYYTIAAEKKITLSNQLEANGLISADKDMLQLIIRNLIDNAIKFTPPGGEIIIADEIAGDACCIIIKDSGIGIPVEQQASIFSLKAASTFGTKNEKGVGLGLVLCKEYIEMQDGKIRFESTPGVGTTFYVSFKLFARDDEKQIAAEAVAVYNL